MNVLFVDDQVSVLNGIAAGVHFEDLGIDKVFYATNGERAMEILNTETVDLMLTDVEMPGEDGLMLNRRVMEKYPEVLRILLTSHAEFEYAQESTRLGCFDYLLQPAPYEEIESALRKALQHIYERNKKNRLYEIGNLMQTNEMELLDRVILNLFSNEEKDVDASMHLLNLMGYPVSREKNAQLLILKFDQFRKTETPLISEKEIHKALLASFKDSGITYPVMPVIAVDHRRQLLVLMIPATQDELEVSVERYRLFFEKLSERMREDLIHCYIGSVVPMGDIRRELLRLRGVVDEKSREPDVVHLEYDWKRSVTDHSELITGSGARWRRLLAAGQRRLLQNEFEACLDNIIAYAPNKQKALCDLHQRVTHMFLTYFYENSTDVTALFRNQYSYTDYMGSFADAESLRDAFYYMLRQVEQLKSVQVTPNDVERAKNFIAENISDSITVRDVADYVCLSAEYFTKLFKRETGQSIKEYITQMKIEAAKDMLERPSISVGMVALELGYTNFSHFSQVFKKYENMTPSEYRLKVTGKAE